MVFILSKKDDKAFFDKIKESMKEAYGEKPVDYHGLDSWRVVHYQRQYLRLAKGCFEVDCRPEWDTDFILDELLLRGYFIITDTALGVIPLRGEAYGNNVWRRPSDVICANHILGNIERKIGIDCEVIYLNGSGDRRGILDIINLFAMRTALCDSAWDINMANSKTTHVFGAADKKEAATLRAMVDEIQEGNPAVFVKSSNLQGVNSEMFSGKAKENFVADLVTIEKQKLKQEFLTLFGVNNANTDKRERLLNAEVQSNNEELMADTEWWCYNLDRYCTRANNMFGGDDSITIRMPFREIDVTISNGVDNRQEEQDDGK